MSTLSNHDLLSMIAEGISPSFINGQHGKVDIHPTLGANETLWFKVESNTDVYITSAAIVTTENKVTVEAYRDIKGSESAAFVEALNSDVISIEQQNKTTKKGDYNLQTKAYLGGTFTPDANVKPFASATASTKDDISLVSKGEPIGMPAGALYIKVTGTAYCKIRINFRELK